MILHLKLNAPIEEIKKTYDAHVFYKDNCVVVITSSSIKKIDQKFSEFVIKDFVLDNDIQLASKNYLAKREISLSDNVVIGGNTQNTVLITGPCSVESEEQIEKCAEFCISNDIKIIRAGCYKPRTSPYTFQGLGNEGLRLLVKVREKYGLKIITEAKDSSHIDEIIENSDIIQIGAKAMYDHAILKACSKINKPVLIKRGFGSTLQEFVQSAEFVLSGGNNNVILCERGIRTFENKTRFTLDLCGVAYLKEYTNLPVILDPSHAMGYSYGVADLSRACVAMGIDGLLIETHPNPKIAKSDASQQLDFQQFEEMNLTLKKVAESIGRNMI